MGSLHLEESSDHDDDDQEEEGVRKRLNDYLLFCPSQIARLKRMHCILHSHTDLFSTALQKNDNNSDDEMIRILMTWEETITDAPLPIFASESFSLCSCTMYNVHTIYCNVAHH